MSFDSDSVAKRVVGVVTLPDIDGDGKEEKLVAYKEVNESVESEDSINEFKPLTLDDDPKKLNYEPVYSSGIDTTKTIFDRRGAKLTVGEKIDVNFWRKKAFHQFNPSSSPSEVSRYVHGIYENATILELGCNAKPDLVFVSSEDKETVSGIRLLHIGAKVLLEDGTTFDTTIDHMMPVDQTANEDQFLVGQRVAYSNAFDPTPKIATIEKIYDARIGTGKVADLRDNDGNRYLNVPLGALTQRPDLNPQDNK